MSPAVSPLALALLLLQAGSATPLSSNTSQDAVPVASVALGTLRTFKHAAHPQIVGRSDAAGDPAVDASPVSADSRRTIAGSIIVVEKVEGEKPRKRTLHSMVEVGSVLYLFGGQGVDSAVLFDDMWSLDLKSNGRRWNKLRKGPTARKQHVLIPQPNMGASGSVLLMGGQSADKIDRCTLDGKEEPCGFDDLTDMWSYDIANNTWQRVGEGPSALNWGFHPKCSKVGPPTNHIKFVRAGDKQILSFGGFETSFCASNSGGRPPKDATWVMTRTDINSSVQWSWRELSTRRPRPPARFRHDMAWVSYTDVLVLFGGESISKTLGDTWHLTITAAHQGGAEGTWKQVNALTAPPPRLEHSMVSLGRHVYLHGGRDPRRALTYNDVWRFSVVDMTWSEMPSFQLPSRAQFAMTPFPDDYIYLLGGTEDGIKLDAMLSDDLWRVDTALVCEIGSYYDASSGMQAGQCKACRICPSGEYQSSDCTAVNDRVCVPCSPCSNSQYEDKSCMAQADRICLECDTLGCSQDIILGSGVDEGGFANVWRDGCGLGSKGECKKCTSCRANEYLKEPCAAQRDRVCDLCTNLATEECRLGAANATSGTAETVSKRLEDCGYGKRGKCVTLSRLKAERTGVLGLNEPLWVSVVIGVVALLLVCTIVGVYVHLRRWRQRKKKQRERANNLVESFQAPSFLDLERAPNTGSQALGETNDLSPVSDKGLGCVDAESSRGPEALSAAGVGLGTDVDSPIRIESSIHSRAAGASDVRDAAETDNKYPTMQPNQRQGAGDLIKELGLRSSEPHSSDHRPRTPGWKEPLPPKRDNPAARGGGRARPVSGRLRGAAHAQRLQLQDHIICDREEEDRDQAISVEHEVLQSRSPSPFEDCEDLLTKIQRENRKNREEEKALKSLGQNREIHETSPSADSKPAPLEVPDSMAPCTRTSPICLAKSSTPANRLSPPSSKAQARPGVAAGSIQRDSSLSPAMAQVLDTAAATRMRLARERGRYIFCMCQIIPPIQAWR